MYIYIWLTQTRTVTCYVSDPSSHQEGRPVTSKTSTVLTTAKIFFMSPRWAQHQDGGTD